MNPEKFDSWRVFPRIFISAYIFIFYEVGMWFMTLEEPNNAQAAFASAVIAAGAAWFNSYVKTGGVSD